MGNIYSLTLTALVQLASGRPSMIQHAAGVVVDTATLNAVLSGIRSGTVTLSDSATFLAPASGNILTALAVADSMTMSDTDAAAKLVVVALSEDVELNDVLSGNALLDLELSENLGFALILQVNGENFVVWAANADTFAHSRYENFNFNSMCRLGDRYYGAGDDGIYALDATTDAGAEIKFFVSMPTTDFKDSHDKRLPKVYLGFKSDGPMYLQVQTEDGKRRIYLFNKKSPQMAGSGATLGRGVKSRYFTFDLINGEGARVVLDSIEFFPIVLIRRINS